VSCHVVIVSIVQPMTRYADKNAVFVEGWVYDPEESSTLLQLQRETSWLQSRPFMVLSDSVMHKV